MRPLEYRDFLVDLLQRTPGVQGAKAIEASPYPFALAAQVGGRELRWQVIGQLADGSRHDSPAAAVQAGPPAFTEAPVSAAPDAWLAGAIGAAEPADTARFDVWSARESKQDPGVTVHFHNGERAYLRSF